MATEVAKREQAFAEEAHSQEPKSLLDSIVERQAEVGARYMPAMSIEQAIERHRQLRRYIQEVLVDGEDYGTVPGVDKPFLYKAGAEKLCCLFGYAPHFSVEAIEDWTGETRGEPLFYYKFTCTLTKDGKPVGEGVGSCNSWESKYRYRWVQESDAKRRPDFATLPVRSGTIREFAFAIEKAQTEGQYGKPAEYWQKWRSAIESGEARQIKKKSSAGKDLDAWEMGGSMVRVPNDQFPDVINTCQKMGQKRAYVAATLSATGASQYFSQDEGAMEKDVDADDNGGNHKPADTGGHPINTKAAQEYVRDRKLSEAKAQEEQRQATKPAVTPTEEPKAGAASNGAGSQSAGDDYEKLPPDIQKLWQRMGGKISSVCAVFAELKQEIENVSGSEAGYYEIVRKHGFQHANDVKTLGLSKARQCAREMYETIERWKAKMQPPAADAITDDDIPDVLGGTFQTGVNPAEARIAEARQRQKEVA